MKLKLTSGVLLLVFLPFILFSQTGKIEGTVIDAETGSGLVGVNIVIEGTYLGAATDGAGYFSILNVPPGSHTIVTTMIGYDNVRILDVRVNIHQTTTLHIEMREMALELDEITIVAERPIVQRDVSASVVAIELESIETMPVQSIDQVLSMHAGVQMGREGILVRGGSARETIFLVDGLSLNDERTNVPYTAVSLSSLQEVQIQTGGFNAEYGNVRSGVVNVVTNEGSVDMYSARAIIHYSHSRPKNFGPSVYAQDSYFNRPFTDPDVMWTGTYSGVWDDHTRRQYPSFEGWNAVSAKTIEDGDPATDLTPEQAYRIWKWHRRREGDIMKPDYVVDFGFGGPVPAVSSILGDLRFFATYFHEREMFVFPLSRDSYTNQFGQIRFTSNITPSMKISVSGLYGELRSVSPHNWTTTPTGYILRNQDEIANIVTDAAVLYMPGYYSPSSIYRNMIGVRLTNAISPRTFYEFRLQYNKNKYNTFQIAERDTTRRYEIFPGYFVDESPFGYYGYSMTSFDGVVLGGWMNLGRDRSRNSTTALNFDITSQMTTNHQVKAGFHFTYNDYRIRSFTESPSMDTWNRRMIYEIFPYRFSVYIQDKMEYGGFIANVGVRLEYSDPNAAWYDLEPFDEFLAPGFGHKIEEEVPRRPVEAVWAVSPRLGISHPITENSKLYFNYGHFRSEPTSSLRFRLQREHNGLVTHLGNPALHLEKTVAYEIGFEQNIFDKFLLRLAAYYKNITDQPGWVYYESFDGSVRYQVSENNNYVDIRGFEATLEKRAGRWLTGFINYTYDVNTSGFFGLREYYQDPTKQRIYKRLNPYQSRPRPQPYARTNVTIRTPDEFGPEIVGSNPLGGWLLSLLADWRAGAYYTFNQFSTPGVADNVRWKDWYNVDLRLARNFKFMDYGFQFFIDISNALNVKYLSMAGFSDQYDWDDYLKSLRFPWGEGVFRGNDKIGDYRPWDVPYDPLEPNPTNDPEIDAKNKDRIETRSYIDNPNIRALSFLNPRHIAFGIRITL
jgi:outer membrane receptor protein involved in Fe transport